jgi:phage-related minor tail protein
MSDANLMFNLLGKDVSASKALGSIHSKGKAVAAGVAGAFGGMAIGTMFAKSLEEGKIDSQLNATMSGVPGMAEKVATAAGENYRAGWGTSLQDNVDAVKAVGKSMMDLGKSSPEDIKAVSTSAMGLAKIMGTDVTGVTQAAGKMMKNGLAPDAKGALDMIAAGMKSGANGSGDFLATVDRFGPTFKKLGLTGAEAGALMGAGIKSGAPSAAMVMKAYMTMGASVQSGSKKSGAALTAMGLNAKQMAMEMAKGGPSAKAASSKVIEALESMKDPVKQQAAGVALFGKGWVTMGKDTVAALDPAKLSVNNVTGAAAQMGATLQDNAATKVEAMKRSFEHLGVEAVSLPGPLGLIGAGVAALGPQGMAMAASLASAAGAIGNMGIASKVTAGATKVWTAAQWLFNIALDANPIGLIIIAIAALVAAFIFLWTHCEWFRNLFIGMWEHIKNIVGDVVSWFGSVWGHIIQWFIDRWNNVKNVFTSIWHAFPAIIGGVVSYFSNTWGHIIQWFVDRWNNVKNVFAGIWNGMQAVISAVVNYFSNTWHSIIQWFIDRWNNVKNIFAGIWNAMPAVIGGVGSYFKNTWNGIFGWFADRWQNVKNIISGVWNWIKDKAAGIADFFKTPINWVINAMNWMIDKLNGIHIDTPDVPGTSWGGQHFGFKVDHIPNLARGGIIMPRVGGTLARIGEAGHAEAVIPLNRMGGMGTTVNITVTGTLVGTKDALAVAVHDAVKGAQRRGALPAGAFQ